MPYDFIRKKLSIAVKTDKGNLMISKGAFSQISNICTQIRLPDESVEKIDAHRTDIERRFEEFGEQGARVIAICYKEIESGKISKNLEAEMIFVEFILLHDPVKEGIAETIREWHKLKVWFFKKHRTV